MADKLLPLNDAQISLLRSLVADESSAVLGGETSYGTENNDVIRELAMLATNLSALAAGEMLARPTKPGNIKVKGTGSVTSTGGGVANSGVVIS